MNIKAPILFLVAFIAIIVVQNNTVVFADSGSSVLQYTWRIISKPQDELICTLWTGKQPLQADVRSACGKTDLSAYQLQAVDINTGTIACEVPASGIYTIDTSCHLFLPLDSYRLLVIEPDVSRLLCSVITLNPSGPSDEEIIRACGKDDWYKLRDGSAQITMVSSGPTPEPEQICNMPQVPDGAGIVEQPTSADQLATSADYALLAGRIIFYGGAPAAEQCPGWGLLPSGAADTCGLDAARSAVIAMQNAYDAQILQASIDNQVPARLLKAIIAKESQFWPLWQADNETSLIQLTDNGMDVLLQYDPYIYNQLCPGCDTTYGRQSEATRRMVRQALRQKLGCPLCDVNQAIQAARANVPIMARALRAYRCLAAELVRKQTGQAPSSIANNLMLWQLTVAAYHGGYGCAERAVTASAPALDWEMISSNLCQTAQQYTSEVVK